MSDRRHLTMEERRIMDLAFNKSVTFLDDARPARLGLGDEVRHVDGRLYYWCPQERTNDYTNVWGAIRDTGGWWMPIRLERPEPVIVRRRWWQFWK